MRDEWIEIDGGKPALKRWPETPAEATLSDVERAVLISAVRAAAPNHECAGRQAQQALAACRHYTSYGVYIDLAYSSEVAPLQQGEHIRGGATLNWRQAAKAPLTCIAILELGVLSLLELFPSDGEGWSVQECQAISSAALEAVEIRCLSDSRLSDLG